MGCNSSGGCDHESGLCLIGPADSLASLPRTFQSGGYGSEFVVATDFSKSFCSLRRYAPSDFCLRGLIIPRCGREFLNGWGDFLRTIRQAEETG